MGGKSLQSTDAEKLFQNPSQLEGSQLKMGTVILGNLISTCLYGLDWVSTWSEDSILSTFSFLCSSSIKHEILSITSVTSTITSKSPSSFWTYCWYTSFFLDATSSAQFWTKRTWLSFYVIWRHSCQLSSPANFSHKVSTKRLAPLNVVPLSEHITIGNPLRDTNLLKQFKKHSVDKSETTSKCTALVDKHVNNETQTFTLSATR